MFQHLRRAALLIAIALLSSASAEAAGLSFNLTNSTTSMAAGDLAGAPGSRVGNWNNVAITTNASATTLSTVKDDSGATVAGVSMTFNPGSSTVTPGGAGGTNDANLFSNFYDEFGAPAASVQVTNIPYALYDVLFYRNGTEANAATRAGQFTIGSDNRYVRGGLANPDNTGAGYVISNDTTFSGGTTTQGNYVRFSNLTGSTLNASFVGVNAGDTTLRNKVVGFQIVAVPEPAAASLLAVAGSLLLTRRRRSA